MKWKRGFFAVSDALSHILLLSIHQLLLRRQEYKLFWDILTLFICKLTRRSWKTIVMIHTCTDLLKPIIIFHCKMLYE